MKNPILDILNLQKSNTEKQQILESKNIYDQKLAEEQEQIEKYNYYKETFGHMGMQSKQSIFKANVEKELLSEGLNRIFSGCVKTLLYENSTLLKKHLVSSFVNESGVDNLMNRFSEESYLLSELTRLVIEYTDVICEKARENKDEIIDPTDKEEFYEKIDGIADVGNIQDTVKLRVADAFNQFNINNTEKKRDIENILIQSRENINANMTEEIMEYTKLQNKQKENKIRNSKKTIFESMMYNIIESCYKNNDLKEKFFEESGQPDIDKIVDHCKIMYGFMEMLNTTGAEHLSPEYIKEQVDNLRIS